MIRKPTEQDFKEGTAVTVLRESKRTAAASRDGVQIGLRSVGTVYFKGLLWLIILSMAIPMFHSGRWMTALFFLVVVFGGKKIFNKKDNLPLYLNKGGAPSETELLDPAAVLAEAKSHSHPQMERRVSHQIRQSGKYTLSVPIAVRQTIALIIPAGILMLLGMSMTITLIPGLVLFVTALLIIFKAIFDRDLLIFDHRQVTVNSLLGNRTVQWEDVVDVSARVHSRLNLKVLIIVGSRRTIVITATLRGGGLTEVLVPLDLLDLDRQGVVDLVANLISCSAAQGEKVDAWQPERYPVKPEYRPSPSRDPRESFDPDAIMARYLAERQEMIETVRPDLADTRSQPAPSARVFPDRKTFGRKVA